MRIEIDPSNTPASYSNLVKKSVGVGVRDAHQLLSQAVSDRLQVRVTVDTQLASSAVGTTSRDGERMHIRVGLNTPASRIAITASHETLHAIRNSTGASKWRRVGATCLEEGLAMHLESYLEAQTRVKDNYATHYVPDHLLTRKGSIESARLIDSLRRTLPPPFSFGSRSFTTLIRMGPLPEIVYATGFSALCLLRAPADPIDAQLFLAASSDLFERLAEAAALRH